MDSTPTNPPWKVEPPLTPPEVTVFDGHDSIGGTKILFQQGRSRLLLDFGTNYQKLSRFFEEYLQPRPSRGITDQIALGLLPPRANLYRRDLLPPADYPEGDSGWPDGRVDALLLTHGHLDHCGAMAFLDPTIPIICSPTTLALLRSWQETGKTDLSSEVTYFGVRRPVDGGGSHGRILEGDRTAAKQSRRFQLLGGPSAALQDLWIRSPYSEGGSTRFEPRPLEATPSRLGEEGLRYVAHMVDHSIYGAVAFEIEADGGTVAYSGDLRFHGERGAATEAFVRALERRPPELLIVEGTRLRAEGDHQAPPRVSEEEVERNCRSRVEEYPGRLVVADFGPRNVERLRRFRRIALETDRQLVLTPKDAYLLHLLHASDPQVEIDIGPGGMRILEEPTTRSSPWLRQVRDLFADSFLTPDGIIRSPGRYLLCFSFFDCNDLVDLRAATPGGLWLYSSSEAHGEEQEFDFERLQQWILWAGMHAVGFRYEDDPTARGRRRLRFDHPEDRGHHASGHATQEELLEFIQRASPRRILPVHTSQRPERYEALLRERGIDVSVIRPDPERPERW